MPSSNKNFACPCCGYKTLDEKPPGTDIICPTCFWHDDYVQFNDPDYGGGANKVSLRQAQKNFSEFGACEVEMKVHVREPEAGDEKDVNWQPL